MMKNMFLTKYFSFYPCFLHVFPGFFPRPFHNTLIFFSPWAFTTLMVDLSLRTRGREELSPVLFAAFPHCFPLSKALLAPPPKNLAGKKS